MENPFTEYPCKSQTPEVVLINRPVRFSQIQDDEVKEIY